ncbi:hypothetical protein P9112_005198 [Eukaryota sp. TZLM1-RC]
MLSALVLLILAVLAACSTSNTILFSDPYIVEPLLEGIHSSRALHILVTNIDDNHHPDAIVIYLTNTGTISGNNYARYSYKVLYDIAVGHKDWHGKHGFYPNRVIGHSPSYSPWAIRMRAAESSTSFSCNGITRNREETNNYHHGVSFATADLDGNGRPEIITVGAITGVHADSYYCYSWRSCTTDEDGEEECVRLYSIRNRSHIALRLQIVWNLGFDGSSASQTGSASSVRYFQVNSVNNGHLNDNTRPSAIKVVPNGCDDNEDYDHLLYLYIANVRASFCFNNNLGIELSSVSSSRTSPGTSHQYSASTLLGINGIDYILSFGVSSTKNRWSITGGSSSGSYSSTASALSDEYVGVGSYDFDGDGVDDVITLQCSSSDHCELRHGLVFIPETGADSAHDADFGYDFL